MNDLKNEIIIGKRISSYRLVRTIHIQSLIYFLFVISKLIISEIYNNEYVSFYYSMNAVELIKYIFYLVNVGVFFTIIFWGITFVIAHLSRVDRVRLIHISFLFIESLIVEIVLLLEVL